MKHPRKRWHIPQRLRTIVLVASIALVALFIVGNAVLWAVYRERTYPRTRIMDEMIGSAAFKDLPQRIQEKKLLPAQLEFVHGAQKTSLPLSELGIVKDSTRSVQSAKTTRSWLPILNFFRAPTLQAPVKINETTLGIAASTIGKTIHKNPANAHLTLQGAAVTIQKEIAGYALVNNALKQRLLESLDRGDTTIPAPVRTIKPEVLARSLAPERKKIQAEVNTNISYTYNGKTISPNGSTVASWYNISGTSFEADAEKVQVYIMQVGQNFGIRVKDAGTVATQTVEALAKHQDTTLTLSAQIAVKTYTYCIAAKGVDAGNIPALRSKLESAYTNMRGWSLDGLVEFKAVNTGCSFTVWLSASSLMSTFGSICDVLWSCRVGPNVIINFDRWQNASPSWNANGGSLEEYRHMVINHETGHWLGFGHSICPGAGQPAPVMQQQSIDLQGCTFNPWPTPSELATLRRTLGI